MNPISEWVAKIAAETRNQFKPVFPRDLLAYLRQLSCIAHHHAEMPHAVRFQLLDFEHCQELMLAKFEKRIALAFVEFLEIEDILVEGDRLLHVIYFNGDMIASVHLHAHMFALSGISGIRKPGVCCMNSDYCLTSSMHADIKETFLTAYQPMRWKHALYAGLIAGVLFVIFAKGSPWTSSLITPAVVGRELQAPDGRLGGFDVIVAGLHLLVSLAYALMLTPLINCLKSGPAVLAGGLIGVVLYFLNLCLFTVFFPTLPEQRESVIALTHIAFGMVVAAIYKGMGRTMVTETRVIS